MNFVKWIGPDYWEKRKSVFDFRQDVESFLNQGKMVRTSGAPPSRSKVPQSKLPFEMPRPKPSAR